jgi:hypothetical protein
MIPNIVPIETYSVDETGYWKRLPLVSGIMMMVIGTAIVWTTIGDSLRPVEILERGIGGGAGFGILLPFALRRRAKRSIESVLTQPGSVVSGAVCRLVCSRIITQSHVVPGALFFEPSQITFLPRLAHQSHLSIEIPSATVAVSMERRPRNFMQRALCSSDPVLMRLDSPPASALFNVPAPSQTIPRVRTVVEDLRQSGRATV